MVFRLQLKLKKLKINFKERKKGVEEKKHIQGWNLFLSPGINLICIFEVLFTSKCFFIYL